MECGIALENYNDVKVGDVIEAFVKERVPEPANGLTPVVAEGLSENNCSIPPVSRRSEGFEQQMM